MAADDKDLKIKVWLRLVNGIDTEQPSDQLLDGFVAESSNLRVHSAGQIGTDLGF